MNLVHRWICRSASWKKRLEQNVLPWVLSGVDLGPDVLEVGPGPGLTTDFLRGRCGRLTAIEIDARLAASLGRRLGGAGVRVVRGDAAAMPFASNTFTGAVCFTMLHHVPSPVLQDKLLREVNRVLKPGAPFVGVDSLWSRRMQILHIWDTLVPVDPATFADRLKTAGFLNAAIALDERAFRFSATR